MQTIVLVGEQQLGKAKTVAHFRISGSRTDSGDYIVVLSICDALDLFVASRALSFF